MINKTDLKNLSAAVRLKHFHMDLDKIISDRIILDQVQGCQIRFYFENCPELFSSSCTNGRGGSFIQVDQEIRKCCRKEQSKKFIQVKPTSALNIFSSKERYRALSCDRYKEIKQKRIPYEHFKMESLFLLKKILRKEDDMCKIDLRDSYFSVPLHPESQKFVRFQRKGFCLTKNKVLSQLSKGIWDIYLNIYLKREHDYGRVCSWGAQQGSRFPVTEQIFFAKIFYHWETPDLDLIRS